MDLVFGFYEFIIEAIFLIVTSIRDASFRCNEAERRKASDKARKELLGKYPLKPEDLYTYQQYYYRPYLAADLIREEIDAIIDANPTLTEKQVLDKYGSKLIEAYFGGLSLGTMSIRISGGGPLCVEESIVFSRQIEKLMGKHGHHIRYMYVPGYGYSLNDVDSLAHGYLETTEYIDASTYKKECKRLYPLNIYDR